jgi:aspartyl-tRNA(Asn)/glutamyl-tRNA(Gln) amidotransferase subunit A
VPSTDPADLGLAEAAAAIAAGTLAPATLVDACLVRAAEIADLGAFVAVDADGARRAAARPPAGPLGGVPVAVKDLVDVAGVPTRAGSRVTGEDPASADAPVVGLLRAAGAVVMGKTATHELAFGVTTRAVRNPLDRGRLAGGSSGGAAVAVAAGACPLALGSDTAGSCRIPAAFCGVAGMTARPGRLPAEGVVPLAPGLDALGFLARSAADLAFAWAAVTGEAVDPAPAPRVATAPEAALGAVDPAALAAAEAAAARIGRLGGGHVEAAIPALDDFSRPRGTVIGALALRAHRARGWWPGRAARYGPDVAAELRRAERIDAAALHEAHARLAALAERLRDALSAVDVLVLPTTPRAAPPRDGEDTLARQDRRHAAEFTRLCGPFNAAGLAAVSAPLGRDADGLPLGVQFVARDEVTALAAAAAAEALAGAPAPPAVAIGAAVNEGRGTA